MRRSRKAGMKVALLGAVRPNTYFEVAKLHRLRSEINDLADIVASNPERPVRTVTHIATDAARQTARKHGVALARQ